MKAGELNQLLNDKTLKGKAKTETLSELILNAKISVNELIGFAKTAKDPVKATCIEALEFATKSNPEAINEAGLQFCIESLKEKAPRIKWESAKVIGNTIHLHPKKIDAAVTNLLVNTEHTGTVVRWSAAFALSQIVLLKSAINKSLVPALENICEQEEKNSIKKIYQAAFKKIK